MTLRDLKRCKLSGNFFNILFNLNKFVAFETRDPFLIRQVISFCFCNSTSSFIKTITKQCKLEFLYRSERIPPSLSGTDLPEESISDCPWKTRERMVLMEVQRCGMNP